jgi:hypothetical protein
MRLQHNSIVFDNGFTVSLQRTIRLPEDGKTHALPPGMGAFPIRRVEDYKDKVPPAWNQHQGVFIPMFEREAMWFSFGGSTSAIKVATGKVNALNGKAWTPELQENSKTPGSDKEPSQDYMVAPYPQPWLDGFNTGDGVIRQFVAMQLGKGYTVEGQVTGKEDVGGFQLLVVPTKPGKITRQFGRRALEGMGGTESSMDCLYESCVASAAPASATRSMTKGSSMGMAAGAKLTQTISSDPYSFDTWDESQAEKVFIHVVDAVMWEKITGEKCPASPVPHTEYKGPYFDYDNGTQGIGGSGTLANVKPVSEKDKDHGFVGQQDDTPQTEVHIHKIPAAVGKTAIKDGNW